MTDMRVQLSTYEGMSLKRGKGRGFTVYNCEAKDIIRIIVEAIEKEGYKTTYVRA